MHPVLFRLPWVGWPVHTYGVMIAIGFVIGLGYVVRESRRVGLDPEKMLDVCFWLLVSGFAGARVLFILVNWREYLEMPLAILTFWKGGFVWYGGLITAFGVVVWLLKRKGLHTWRAADVLAPAVIFGLAFGRLGCTSAGCCFGSQVTGHPWWAIFMNGAWRIPSQPIMSLNAMAIFALLLILRRYKKWEGQLTWTLMVIYPITRFLVEYLRGDKERGYVIEGYLSTSQFIGIIFILFALAGYFYYRKRNMPLPETAPVPETT